MAYYMGDYYRGDYYRGDPGLLGTIGKGIAKVAGIGAAFLPGGSLLSGAISAGVGLISGSKQGGAVANIAQGLLPAQPAAAAQLKVGPIGINPSNILPGGAPFATYAGGSASGAACPAGYHPDKKTGERCVRNRHQNPANPKALRRAIRREQGFVALARRSLKGTGLSISRRSFASKKRRAR